MNPIELMPLTITGYYCYSCHAYHKKPSKKFFKCYTEAAKHYGWKTAGIDDEGLCRECRSEGGTRGER